MSTVENGAPIEAILLAGGEGMRLRPLTARLPKPLLPVGNRPLVSQILHGLQVAGIRNAALATGYKSDEMQATLGAESEGVALKYVVENEPLGSGGALRNVMAQCRLADEVWVAGADILHNVDIAAARQFHREARQHGALATVISFEVQDSTGFGICECDARGCIGRFLEKPAVGVTTSQLANSALWIFTREALDLLPKGVSSVERDLFPALAARGDLWTWQHRGFWLDCGTPERLVEANLGALDEAFPLRIEGERVGDSVQGENCSVAPNSLVSRCVLGRDVVVEKGAQLTDCVLLDGVHIDAGAELERCIVERGTRVNPGSTARGEILT